MPVSILFHIHNDSLALVFAMFPQNDTLNSIQNSTINITQLMTTTTTTNRRSRFLNPGQANPAQEDEDIYVSLQVLQAQLNTRSAPPGSQELLERVLSKVDKLQTTVNAFSDNYDFVRRDSYSDKVLKPNQGHRFASKHDPVNKQNHANMQQNRHEAQEVVALKNTIAEKDIQLDRIHAEHEAAQKEIVQLQNELQVTKTRSNELHENAILELRQQVERLEFQASHYNTLQQQVEALSIKVDQRGQFREQILGLQQKVDQFESIQYEKIDLEDKYRFEQRGNNQLLRRNWALEAENTKLKNAIVEMIQEKEEQDIDTMLFSLGTDTKLKVKAMLEEEQIGKTGHASRD